MAISPRCAAGLSATSAARNSSGDVGLVRPLGTKKRLVGNAERKHETDAPAVVLPIGCVKPVELAIGGVVEIGLPFALHFYLQPVHCHLKTGSI